MRTITHLIAGGIAATALVAGTAVTASAQSTTIKDKRADVVHFEDVENDDVGTVLNRADSIASGVDVTSSTVKHGKKSLKVTIRFANLAKSPVMLQSELRARGSKKIYNVANFGSNKRVSVYNSSYSKELCSAKLSRKAGKSGRLSFTIPRSCIKKPKSLKIRSVVGNFPTGTAADPFVATL
ncbi:hypothetical protein [Aeromicrobium sp. P5_D10]